MKTPTLRSAVLAGLLGIATAASAQNPVTMTVSPALPTEGDLVRVTLSTVTDCYLYQIAPPRFEGRRIVLAVSNAGICDPPLVQQYSLDVLLGSLAAGSWRIDAFVDDRLAAQANLEVGTGSELLSLYNRDIDASVEWATKDGRRRGKGHAVPLSSQSGYFWFFDGGNPEILVKVLDGRLINGHWWVFISSNSDLEYTVKVGIYNFEPPGRSEKAYHSPPGANKNFIDLSTF
ncbi:MAG: hypothetical protein ACJ75H_03800 [Thermoanaerobaculia bacterium]